MSEEPKILVVIDLLYSTRDRSGNVYWAFRFTDTVTGKQVCGTFGGNRSNILAMPWLIENRDRYYWTEHALGKRAFVNTVSGFEYAGCAPNAIQAFLEARVKAALFKTVNQEAKA